MSLFEKKWALELFYVWIIIIWSILLQNLRNLKAVNLYIAGIVVVIFKACASHFRKFSIWVALENKSKICRSVPSQRSINYFLPYWHVQGVNFTNMKSARNVLKIMEIIPVTYKLTSFKFMKFCNKIHHIINNQKT